MSAYLRRATDWCFPTPPCAAAGACSPATIQQSFEGNMRDLTPHRALALRRTAALSEEAVSTFEFRLKAAVAARAGDDPLSRLRLLRSFAAWKPLCQQAKQLGPPELAAPVARLVRARLAAEAARAAVAEAATRATEALDEAVSGGAGGGVWVVAAVRTAKWVALQAVEAEVRGDGLLLGGWVERAAAALDEARRNAANAVAMLAAALGRWGAAC